MTNAAALFVAHELLIASLADVFHVVLVLLVIVLAVIGLLVVIGGPLVWRSAKRSERASLTNAADDGGVRAAADALDRDLDWWSMTPEALDDLPTFQSGAEELADEATPIDEVVSLTKDANGWVASMALAALERRDDVPDAWVEWAVRDPIRPSYCETSLLLDALALHSRKPVIGEILFHLDTLRDQLVADFVARRVEEGEDVDVHMFDRLPIGHLETVQQFLDRFEDELGPDFRSAFDEWRALHSLTSVGRVWTRPFDEPPALLAGRRRELIELVISALSETPRRSILLVGEHGVGKTALARAALDRYQGRPKVFETTAVQMIADTIYVGALEGRVSALVDSLTGQDVILVLPELQEALFAGQHSRNPHGLLDALLPHVEAGRITVIAEVTPTAAERVIASRPRVESAFEIVRVRPLDEADTIAVGRHALEQDGLDVTTDDETLSETFDLAQQFLAGVAPPGNLLRLLQATAAEAAEQGVEHFTGANVIATLAATSGLPLSVLDPAAPLPLEEVRAFFERRVLEQPEAVDCIVERLAMIKAGLTDPTRPLGVFLFVGPTGTGKTEIAKTLAEFLFGSADRLVRLDMSEYQTPESLERLLSDTTTEAQGAALVSSIREDPFAVVLLDEFEKAATPIWDLFLQVFDDGRLTDLRGRLVDFRRTVIVLTSNLGSALVSGPGVGFEPSTHTFSSRAVERAIRSSFRPEFLNRLDRVVVFKPFERAAMRAMLDKELEDALARRGLRRRPWAVELDGSAYDFLIEKGFSPELGARPLKRALERYLLTPIAAAIVEQAVPEGDQFLFVTASLDAGVEVKFVDPDEDLAVEDVAEPTDELDLRALCRQPRGDETAVRFVTAELERIAAAVRELDGRKAHGLEAMTHPEFWDRSDRFSVLAEAEYLDRLGAATRTAEKLGRRLASVGRSNGGVGAELVKLLSGRLYVLDRALAGIALDAPTEVVVHIAPTTAADEANAFAALLDEMYSGWAAGRGMQLNHLEAAPGEYLLAVSGLGCGEILAAETGLHVLEHVDKDRDGATIADREHVRVVVIARPEGPEAGSGGLERIARHRLEEAEASDGIVRRYRPGRSPLVRDNVHGYRTGRLDRVLAGDFDLY